MPRQSQENAQKNTQNSAQENTQNSAQENTQNSAQENAQNSTEDSTEENAQGCLREGFQVGVYLVTVMALEEVRYVYRVEAESRVSAERVAQRLWELESAVYTKEKVCRRKIAQTRVESLAEYEASCVKIRAPKGMFYFVSSVLDLPHIDGTLLLNFSDVPFGDGFTARPRLKARFGKAVVEVDILNGNQALLKTVLLQEPDEEYPVVVESREFWFSMWPESGER